MEHFASGLPVVEAVGYNDEHAADVTDSETVQQIKQLLDTRVRPAVAMDGGDLQNFEDGIDASNAWCMPGMPKFDRYTEMGIEKARHYIPEVREVRSAEL